MEGGAGGRLTVWAAVGLRGGASLRSPATGGPATMAVPAAALGQSRLALEFRELRK